MTVIAIIIIGVLSGMVMFSIFGTSGYIADDKDAPLYKTTTAVSEPVHGEWVQISPARIYECSKCGQNVMTNDIKAYKFCHGCGTKMGGEKTIIQR